MPWREQRRAIVDFRNQALFIFDSELEELVRNWPDQTAYYENLLLPFLDASTNLHPDARAEMEAEALELFVKMRDGLAGYIADLGRLRELLPPQSS
jgi:hypothetical protein